MVETDLSSLLLLSQLSSNSIFKGKESLFFSIFGAFSCSSEC